MEGSKGNLPHIFQAQLIFCKYKHLSAKQEIILVLNCNFPSPHTSCSTTKKKNNYVLSQSILTCLEIDRIHSGILLTVTRISNKPYLGLNRALLELQSGLT
ncbi:hypothetical protein, partial [Prevotella denticola]